VSSTTLNSKLLNLVGNWSPGKGLDKAELMSALGVGTDKCNRSSAVITKTGILSNKGDACSIKLDLSDEVGALAVPTEVAGRAESPASGKRVLFDTLKELRLGLPGDLDVYGGPILEISAPANTRVVDIRTQNACVRVHEH